MGTTWPQVKLGEAIIERTDIPAYYDIASGKIPIIAKIGFGDGEIQLRNGSDTKTGMILIRPGDLVVSGINASKGAISINKYAYDIAATIHYGSYFVKPEKADINFLWWLLRSNTFRNILFQHLPGGIKTELKAKRLLEIPIPLPPLAEQRRIVARIDELAAKIEEAKGLRKQAAVEAEAVFIANRAAIMTGISRGGTKPFDQAAVLERGKFSYRPRNDPRFFGGKHPWIQIGEIESSGKYIKTWNETLNDEGLAISRKFPRGTLLISIAATIGAVGILEFDCCVPDSIVAVTPLEGAESEFIYHYLGYLRTHLEKVAPQSAQKNINLQILSSLPFPTCLLAEQRRIVAYLDDLQAKIDTLKKLQVETQKELDALLPSVLDRAFKGEL